MPIPTTREELDELLSTTWGKLHQELEEAGPEAAELSCVDDWCLKDLLAVRAWWTHRVVDWIEAWRRGEDPVRPAPGYAWNETPRLNADIVAEAADEPYESVRGRLEAGYQRVLALVNELDDRELLEPRAHPQAGKWPLARWISINTARQYTTARTYLRRALRERG